MAPNLPIPQFLLPNLQYILQPLQYGPVRVASTVSGPTTPEPMAPSALHAFAAFAAAQLSAHPSFVFTQLAVPPGAQLAVAQPAALQQAVFAQTVAQVGAQPAAQVGAQPAVPVKSVPPARAQLAALTHDWDNKDTNTLLKLSNRAHFTETSGSKI